MLNVEDDSIQLRPPPTTPTTLATSVKEAIRMDHCYTTLTATITSPVRPSETIGTSPVLLNTNTNTARVRGRVSFKNNLYVIEHFPLYNI